LVVRGSEAFRITAVECDDPRFQFEVGPEAKTLHFVPVTFQAAGEPGPLSVTIRIQTDLSGASTSEVTASGTVLP
jgi:aminopeptidase N